MKLDRSITKILFLDIETVSSAEAYEQLNPQWQNLWDLKRKNLRLPEDMDEATAYKERAAIYSEFGKIVCISVGLMYEEQGQFKAKMKSFYGHDEKVILEDFKRLLGQHYNNPKLHALCGHNAKEFDMPYICRRMIIHSMDLPDLLQIHGKKPWELDYILDSMHLWRFGDFKNYTSLKLLAAALGIPSPKDDIDGSMVGKVYYENGDVERIARYCERDVLTVMQIMLRFLGHQILGEEDVLFSTS